MFFLKHPLSFLIPSWISGLAIALMAKSQGAGRLNQGDGPGLLLSWSISFTFKETRMAQSVEE